jgi:hypothetical protein
VFSERPDGVKYFPQPAYTIVCFAYSLVYHNQMEIGDLLTIHSVFKRNVTWPNDSTHLNHLFIFRYFPLACSNHYQISVRQHILNHHCNLISNLSFIVKCRIAT